jgi:hypothetical protein
MYRASAGWPFAAVGTMRMSPAPLAGHWVEMSRAICRLPAYQPVNGGISQTASSVSRWTIDSMS